MSAHLALPDRATEPTRDPYDAAGLPRPIRIAAVAMAVLAIAVAAAGRLTGRGHVTLPGAVPTETRALVFADRADGGVAVRDAVTGAEAGDVGPGEGGFVRGTLRALARQRRARGIGADAPFYLTRWNDGRLTLDDSTTAGHVELGAFGGTNLDAFARLLAPAR